MGYVNNKPVGLTYSNTTDKPVGLSELSSIAVTLVSATSYSGITLSSLGINFTGLQDNYVIVYSSATNSWQVEAQAGGGGGGSSDSFYHIVPTDGDPVYATTSTDTLTYNSPTNTVTITGNALAKSLSVDVVVANLTGIPQSAVTDLTTDIGSLNSYIASMSGAWLSSVSSVSAQSDVQLTGTVTTGQVLKWNGTKWENGTDNTGGGSTTFLELTDTQPYTALPEGAYIVIYDPKAGGSDPIGYLLLSDFQTNVQKAGVSVDSFFGDFSGNTSAIINVELDGAPYHYNIQTSSFELSTTQDWWNKVAGDFSHNQLANLTTGNPHTQYVLTSTNSSLSALVSSIQTSTINLSSYIAANESLWLSGAGNTFSSIQFITGITPTLSIGEVAWNDDYNTLDIQTTTDTTLQVGQEQVIKVRNETGSTLLNGTVVYVSGVHSTGAAKLQVSLATAQNDCTIQNIVGICTQDISHNGDGFITTFGYVRSVNTSGYSVGETIYLANTPGVYTNTQEPKPSHSVRLGTVARSHATDGVIFVKVDPGYDTNFLHNVENSDPESSGEVLIWNDVSGLYQHGGHNDLADLTVGNPHTQYATLSGATFTGDILAPSVSATELSATKVNGGDLATAVYTSIQNRDVLHWQSSTSSWVNTSGALQTSDSLAAGDVFYYNGTVVKKLAKPTSEAVLAFSTGTNAPYWVEAEAGGGNLTLVYDDTGGTIVFSAI